MSPFSRFGAWLYDRWPHYDIQKCAACGGPWDDKGKKCRRCASPTGSLYLRRFFLAEIRSLFAIFPHNIVRDDDERDPHDHPRSFVTIILRGGYTDESWTGVPESGGLLAIGGERCESPTLDVVRAGSIRFRSAEHVHRVRDVLPGTWTLTLWGPYRRDWGFWDENWNFIHWRKYLNIEGEYEGD